MKYAVAVASLFASTVLGQVSVAESAFSAISSATQTLDSAVKAYSGGSITALESDVSALLAAINNGNTAVQGASDFGNDATELIPPINTLTSVVQTAITDTVNAKSTFDSAGAGYTVSQSLQSILAATQKFSATVISKVPTTLQPVASGLAATIISEIQTGVTAYSGEKPTSSSASSGTTTVTTATTGTSSTVVTTSGKVTTSAVTTSTGIVTTTVATTSSVPALNSTYTATISPFSGNAAVPTAAAAYGAVLLAAVGAVVAL